MQKNNFLFLGEAGSGKSEVAVNFAVELNKLGTKEVHFFDMDMTKPLFRSRDLKEHLENLGIHFHYEEQFMDAPVLTGGVRQCLQSDNCFVVMDIGGGDVGARAVGGFAPLLNREDTTAYYVLNSYRPWSGDIDQIDKTMALILGVSHIHLDQIHLVNNPNTGLHTTLEEFIAGKEKMEEMVSPYKPIDFTCIRKELLEDAKKLCDSSLMPLELYLTYPWAVGESQKNILSI